MDDAPLPTHWLHAAYSGADAPTLLAARKAEVASLKQEIEEQRRQVTLASTRTLTLPQPQPEP